MNNAVDVPAATVAQHGALWQDGCCVGDLILIEWPSQDGLRRKRLSLTRVTTYISRKNEMYSLQKDTNRGNMARYHL